MPPLTEVREVLSKCWLRAMVCKLRDREFTLKRGFIAQAGERILSYPRPGKTIMDQQLQSQHDIPNVSLSNLYSAP